MSTTNDDIAAAIASLSGDQPNAQPAAPAASTQDQVSHQPSQQIDGQPRDPNGRFTAASPAAPAATGAPPAAGAPTAATPTPDAPSVAAPAAGDPPAPAAGAAVQLDITKPPSGWSQGSKDKWMSIPEDLRQEIIKREEAGASGVAKLRQQHEPAEKLYAVAKANEGYFQHIKTSPEEYLSGIMQTEQTLALGNPAQKMSTLLQIADDYGVPLRQILDSATGGQFAAMLQQSHQYHHTPAQLPPEYQQQFTALQQQNEQMMASIADAELKQFQSKERPFYEEVREEMANLIEKGLAEGYEDAYERAIWTNPEIRARLLAQQNGQQQQNGVAARQAAAAAAAAPQSASLVAPVIPDDESTEATVRRLYSTQGSL